MLNVKRQTAHSPESQISLTSQLGKVVANLQTAYSDAKAMEAVIEPKYKYILDRQIQEIQNAYRAQAKEALHRAQQLILPGLVAGQAQIPYIDFARVTFIGNGFFLREYYPDAELHTLSVAEKILTKEGKSLTALNEAINSFKDSFPVLMKSHSFLWGVSLLIFLRRLRIRPLPKPVVGF